MRWHRRILGVVKPWVLLLALAVTCLAADLEKTRRVVNGKTVDLKPILEWEKLRRALGEKNPNLPPRPMTQWERISAKPFEGSSEVMVTLNRKNFVVIKNLPVPTNKRGTRSEYVHCLAFRTGLTNYVTAQKIPAAVYDHGRGID